MSILRLMGLEGFFYEGGSLINNVSKNVTTSESPTDDVVPLSLYDTEPVEGIRDQEVGPTQDNLGNTFYKSLKFRVSSFDDSLKSESLVFTNTGSFSRFTGRFYIPKLSEGHDTNVVRFVVRLDGQTKLDTGEMDQYSNPYPVDLDISGVTKVEIACYLVKGTGGPIGGGSDAYGNLADPQFT